MKTLIQIINENLYNIHNYINEELDNNLLYMIDMWLERNDEERQEFIELISKCKTDHIININKLPISNFQPLFSSLNNKFVR